MAKHLRSWSIRLAIAGSFISSSIAAAQEPVTARIDVRAIEIPVFVRDAKGSTPADLRPEDFVLKEDGVEQKIIGLAYPDRRAVVANSSASVLSDRTSSRGGISVTDPLLVIYIQQSLSSSHALQSALRALSDSAASLVSLGAVEVVGDGAGSPLQLIAPTRDAAELGDALRALARTIRGEDRIAQMRRQYLEEGRDSRINSFRAVVTGRLESSIVRERQIELLTWFTRYPPSNAPRTILLVTNGYDTEPVDFYEAADSAARSDLVATSTSALQEQIGEALAGSGWTVVSFAPAYMDAATSPTFDAGNSGHGRLSAFNTSRSSTAINGIVLHPLDPLRTLAQTTGGSVLTDAERLAPEVDALTSRVILTYQTHHRRDGSPHRIVVRSRRAGLNVHAQQWIVSGTPEAGALARATSLSLGSNDRGELPIGCVLAPLAKAKGREVESTVTVTIDLNALAPIRASLATATLRFALAVRSADAPLFTTSKRFEHVDLSKELKWEVAFQVKHRTGATVAVTAEEVATGLWGGCTCAQRRDEGETRTSSEP